MIPKIVDLFSGCGGLTLGFEKAGFEIATGIEMMKAAVETVSYNFDYRYGKEASHICGDITVTDSSVFKKAIGPEGCIVIGGPPCQAYSLAGRAKLKSLGMDREHTKDSRGYLFKDYLRIALELDAKAIVMENVVESVNFGGMNVPELVSCELDEKGYEVFWTVLNAADFGVPQVRERIILIAIKKDIQQSIQLPTPTHMQVNDERVVYSNSLEKYLEFEHFRMPIKGDNLPCWTTVGDALGDLPVLMPNANTSYKQIKMNVSKKYSCEPSNDYQKLMRNWYGYGLPSVTGNSFRNNERDFRIFEQMKQGDNYLDASAIADRLFENEAKNLGINKDDDEYELLKSKRVPVYDRENFTYKWRRLREDRPSSTIVAHLSKDTYSHIHPTEPRGISVREAARLQSFPDDFHFSCSMGDAYKQIGNAVPPLMAYAVAQKIMEAFR